MANLGIVTGLMLSWQYKLSYQNRYVQYTNRLGKLSGLLLTPHFIGATLVPITGSSWSIQGDWNYFSRMPWNGPIPTIQQDLMPNLIQISSVATNHPRITDYHCQYRPDRETSGTLGGHTCRPNAVSTMRQKQISVSTSPASTRWDETLENALWFQPK